MIGLKDINKAIVTQVQTALGGTDFANVQFQSTDIKDGFTRPCFYVEFPDNKTGLYNAFNMERNLQVKIYYFPKDRYIYKLELMELQTYLETIFLKYLQVNDTFFINIDELDFNITNDGILTTTFNLQTVEELPSNDDSYEYMGEIIVNGELMEDLNT